MSEKSEGDSEDETDSSSSEESESDNDSTIEEVGTLKAINPGNSMVEIGKYVTVPKEKLNRVNFTNPKKALWEIVKIVFKDENLFDHSLTGRNKKQLDPHKTHDIINYVHEKTNHPVKDLRRGLTNYLSHFTK